MNIAAVVIGSSRGGKQHENGKKSVLYSHQLIDRNEYLHRFS